MIFTMIKSHQQVNIFCTTCIDLNALTHCNSQRQTERAFIHLST